MLFGMTDLMSQRYERKAPTPPPIVEKKQLPSAPAAPVAPSAPSSASAKYPHQSMRDMAVLVENMYKASEQTSSTDEDNNTPTGRCGAPQRRTREATTASNNTSNGQQIKQQFNEWLKQFDQAVSSADSTEKSQGDSLWTDIVQHVDSTWANYTERGQLPQ